MRVELRRVNKTYSPPPYRALSDVDFVIETGEFVAVVGPSGSGKSTLLNIVGLMDRPTDGAVLFDKAPIDFERTDTLALLRNQRLGFVFQAFHLLPHLSAWANVSLPLLYRGVSSADRRSRAMAMLECVGLSHRADHQPAQLSGGERQRVAIARALVGEPDLILADEPTGSLDSTTADDVMRVLDRLVSARGASILMITHDRSLASRADRCIEIRDGRLRDAA